MTDSNPLAVFYYCDLAVNHQMQELNHLMKTTPDNLDRRATLIRQLKEAQHNLMNVVFAVTRDAVPDHHTCRDFRAKYPDDVLVDQINGESLVSLPPPNTQSSRLPQKLEPLITNDRRNAFVARPVGGWGCSLHV